MIRPPNLRRNERVNKPSLLKQDDIRRVTLRNKAENCRFPGGGVGGLNAAKPLLAPTTIAVPHGRGEVVRDMSHAKRVVGPSRPPREESKPFQSVYPHP